jgi:hypothetical protein
LGSVVVASRAFGVPRGDGTENGAMVEQRARPMRARAAME